MQVQAQQKTTGSIKGTLVDAMNKLPLPDATVTLMSPEDSTAVGFGVTASTGSFHLKNIPAGPYIFYISYTGYNPLVRNIEIAPLLLEIDMDTVLLYTDTSMMAGVVVTAPPIKVKKIRWSSGQALLKRCPMLQQRICLKNFPAWK
jgi:hypothetical protein